MVRSNSLMAAFLAAAVVIAAPVHAALSDDIHTLQQQWALVNYEMPEDGQDEAFERLTEQADAVVGKYPEAAEPLVWKAIIVSSHAGATGGLGALGKAKEARRLLEQAKAIDPEVLKGSIYTSLGSLYYQVPGWPFGFGDDDKAERFLKTALSINPDGIDPNYFYGHYLLDQRRYDEAVVYLEKALTAPPRPDRPLADKGRRAEAQEALDEARKKLD